MEKHIGSHCKKIDKNLIKCIKKIQKRKGNVIQFFLTNDIFYNDLLVLKKYIQKNGIIGFVHSSYTINIANIWDEYSIWVNLLIKEIKIAHLLGLKGIILHIGKQLKLDKNNAYNNMYSSLLYIHTSTIKYNIKIILETPAGIGTEMCFMLEDFAYFYNKFKINNELKNRIKICIDTCHIFVSGYNISNKKGINLYLNKFDKLIGIDNIYAIHLNDSVYKCGSRKDMHANIGDGYIGKNALLKFAEFFINKQIPIILETPDPQLHIFK
jgi:deoxyribonuclease-4